MSDFVAFLPDQTVEGPPAAFAQIERDHREVLRADDVRIDLEGGAALLRTSSSGRTPGFFGGPDGWVVLKGLVFDTRSSSPEVDLEDILRCLLSDGPPALNRYEGAFAAVAWDARSGHGWAFNDQASILNLYYAEREGGLWVTTCALPLARALGLALSPDGVREFVARGAVIAPSTMFDGLQRVSIGEHVRYDGTFRRGRHWSAYQSPAEYRSIEGAAEKVAAMAADRIERFASVGGQMVVDLTGGLDSRLLAGAADFAGLHPEVTVNGPPGLEDVRIALQVAAAAGWPMHHFETPLVWTEEITAEMRRELTYRTGGESPFTEIYHHRITRPTLAGSFRLHAIGIGGEFLRYHPWGQEFMGIGRRRLANVGNVLRYRLLEGPPPKDLFRNTGYDLLVAGLRDRVRAVCLEEPESLTTQQLDAVHVWKMTGHSSFYLSSVWNWLPSVAPLLTAGFLETGVAMPWRMRLTGRLQRGTIERLCPRAARVPTQYGGTGGRMRASDVPLELWQLAKRSGHLMSKLDQVLLGGRGARVLCLPEPAGKGTIPYLTREFRDFLRPKALRSRELYDPEGLRGLLGGTDPEWLARETWILRLATIEQLCAELDCRPDADLLSGRGSP